MIIYNLYIIYLKVTNQGVLKMTKSHNLFIYNGVPVRHILYLRENGTFNTTAIISFINK